MLNSDKIIQNQLRFLANMDILWGIREEQMSELCINFFEEGLYIALLLG